MGSVADKIAEKLLSSRGSKIVAHSSWREARKLALEVGFGDDGPVPGRFADLEPCHARYVVAENIVSMLSEAMCGMKEVQGYVTVAGDAEDEYMPVGPPMSPLTVSYFSMWAMFDVRFGRSRETMGSCILRIAAAFDFPSWLTDAIEGMQRSRMGFYVHCGTDDDGVLLREVGTREIVSCSVPAGYAGREGEIWFVRVLPPPHHSCPRHIVFITPYVIRDYPERAFVDYLERERTLMTAGKKSPGKDGGHRRLMKYGPDPYHWIEYIHCAFTDYQYDAIFLTGIPDILESFPHA